MISRRRWPSRSGRGHQLPTLDSGHHDDCSTRITGRNLAGSHRAPRQPGSASLPRWAIVVAVVAALVPATAITAHRVFDSGPDSPRRAATDLPIPPVSSSTSPSATPTTPTTPAPSAAPSRTATPAARHLPAVAPDAPRRITSGGRIDSGFDSSVTGLDASSDAEVARWEPRGSPGSPGTDTVYVIGRVRADGDSAFAGLPGLERGATVSIRTDRGTMTYRVTAARLRPESGLAGETLFRTHRKGRLVLVGIRYDDSGDRLDRALVVTAELSAAATG